MRYLVLGSAGQIGLSLCRYLRDQGHSVVEFDVRDGDRYDLRAPNNTLLDQAVKRCDFVFFLAWDVGGSTYLARYQDTYDFVANNVKIMNNVFDVLHRHGTPFIFASSQMSSMSYSPYGLTKRLAEKITETLLGVTVKFWNVYGIEHDREKAHVVTDFIRMAQNNRRIEMRTDGTELRQMLHADDCSRALHILSQQYADLPRDQEYHITSFEWTSVARIAEIVAGYFPDTEIVPGADKDLVQKDARNEPNEYILNYWRPEISLEEGLRHMIETLC